MLRAIVRISQHQPSFELSLLLKGKNRVMLRMKDEVLEKTLIRIAKNLEEKKSKSRGSDMDIPIAIYKGGDESKLEPDTLNTDAFVEGNVLVVGSDRYKILVNPPTIKSVVFRKEDAIPGLRLSATVELLDLSEKEISYCWELQRDGGDWVVAGSARLFDVTEEHVGAKIRLTCHSHIEDVEARSSPVSGPIAQCPNVTKLLSRVIPVHANSTRVMSYNILADSFMRPPNTKPPASHFKYCPAEYQTREYREARIVAEICGHNPSICCMQEVEGKTYDKMMPVLAGYSGNLTVIRGRQKAGCATIYNTEHFEQIRYESFALPTLYNPNTSFAPSSLVALAGTLTSLHPHLMSTMDERPIMTQITVLKCKSSGNIVIVANTHLYWHPKAAIVRVLHVHGLMTKISTVYNELREQHQRVSVLVCGDMNSQPGSLVDQYLVNGSLSEDQQCTVAPRVEYDNKKHVDENPNLWHFEDDDCCDIAALLTNPLALNDARGDPLSTNYTKDFKACLDYIVCDAASEVVQTVPMHSEADLSQNIACPSAVFPSDHLPLISDIRLASKV